MMAELALQADDRTGTARLFDGPDLLVLAEPRADRSLLVVTFTGRGRLEEHGSGAGHGFLLKNELSAVHFISKANHWWQTPDFAAALRVVRDYAAGQGFRSIATYGSSMGGYGALAASGPLQAARVVAFVPQFTIDLAKLPWETRFKHDARRIDFRHDDLGREMGSGPITVFIDPFFEFDRKHVELIRRHRPAGLLAVPFAEHDVSAALADAGILSATVLDALRGVLDPEAFRRSLRAGRAGSWMMLAGAARLLQRQGHRARALRLTERAWGLLQVRPGREAPAERLAESYATLLRDEGRHEAALEILAGVEARKGSAPGWLLVLRGELQERRGEVEAARTAFGGALLLNRLDRKALGGFARQIGGAYEAGLLLGTGFREDCLRYPSSAAALAKTLERLGLTAEHDALVQEAGQRFPDIKRFRRTS